MKKKIRKKKGKSRKHEEIPLVSQKSLKSRKNPKGSARPPFRFTSIISSLLIVLAIFALVVVCKRLDEKIKHVKVESSLDGIQRQLLGLKMFQGWL